MKIKSVLQIVCKSLVLVFKLNKKWFVLNFSVGVIQTACIVGTTILMQHLFDSLSGTLIKGIFSTLFGLAIVSILSEVLNGYQNYLYGIYIEKGKMALSQLLHKKCLSYSAECFNDPKFLNMIEKANKGVENTIELVLVVGDLFTFYGLYFVLMGVYLFSINKILPIIIIAIFIPVLISHMIKIKSYVDLEDETSQLRRKMDHYKACIKDRSFLRETRLLNATELFSKKYMNVLKKQIEKQVSIEHKSTLNEFYAKLCTFIGYAGVIIFLASSLIKNQISIGTFGALFSSLELMFSLMDQIISYHLGQISRDMGTIRNFISLINDNSDLYPLKREIPEFLSISLQGVSYNYPKQETPALKDINLEIRKGQTIALVGENGAGKSTLARILLGLYSPTEGTISYKGSKENSVFRSTATFQRFCKYWMTFEDNVIISDDKNNKNIEHVLKTIGSDVKSMDNNTLLGVEIGGIDLSHGQWQSIAIMRTFYRNASMVMLDEPTSAIDPLKEDRFFRIFEQELKDKTGIIVTHRLASVKFADIILVLDHGEIYEMGNHNELMQVKGKYYSMIQKQAFNYE